MDPMVPRMATYATHGSTGTSLLRIGTGVIRSTSKYGVLPDPVQTPDRKCPEMVGRKPQSYVVTDQGRPAIDMLRSLGSLGQPAIRCFLCAEPITARPASQSLA